MSRVTNSVLLRYGINTFWSSWRFSLSLSNSALQLNVFFELFLQNYFFKVLKIQYSKLNITIYLFYLREGKFSFVDNYLTLNKILINNLLRRKKYSFTTGNKQPSKKVIYTSFWSLQKLAYLRYCMLWWVSKLRIIQSLTIYKDVFVPNNKLLFPVTYIFKPKTHRVAIKLKLINQTLKLKILGLICSILIFFYTQRKFFVNFKSLIEKKRDWKLPMISNIIMENAASKQRFYIVLLSFLFLKACILNSYINVLINQMKDKNHINLIKGLFAKINRLFKQRFFPLSGVRFQIAGRLNGKLRKGRFGYILGSVKLMSLDNLCDFSCDTVHTPYGSFSLKLWLCINV